MMTICAWCRCILTLGALPASHGICKACAVKFLEEDK